VTSVNLREQLTILLCLLALAVAGVLLTIGNGLNERRIEDLEGRVKRLEQVKP
jgi:hypothetical protein